MTEFHFASENFTINLDSENFNPMLQFANLTISSIQLEFHSPAHFILILSEL